jgi:hypothetical protein
MGIDYNYWKDAYQSYWGIAKSKEDNVKKIVQEICKCKCEFVGLGAGREDYLPGSAKSRSFEKGGSDLHVCGTNIYIEVTGPNIDSVDEKADLWIRPDKIEYARNNPDKNCWIVHALKKRFLLRAINLNKDFLRQYENNKFRLVHPRIRGLTETYTAVPANSPYIQDIENMFSFIELEINKKK